MVAPLTKDIVIYTNGDANVTEKLQAAVECRRVIIEPRRITSLQQGKDPNHPEILVHLEDGDTRTEAFLVSNT